MNPFARNIANLIKRKEVNELFADSFVRPHDWIKRVIIPSLFYLSTNDNTFHSYSLIHSITSQSFSPPFKLITIPFDSMIISFTDSQVCSLKFVHTLQRIFFSMLLDKSNNKRRGMLLVPRSSRKNSAYYYRGKHSDASNYNNNSNNNAQSINVDEWLGATGQMEDLSASRRVGSVVSSSLFPRNTFRVFFYAMYKICGTPYKRNVMQAMYINVTRWLVCTSTRTSSNKPRYYSK